MAHTYTSLLYHVIFSTKDRRPFLDAESRARLFPYLGGIVRELAGVPLGINGPADHVHILASLPPTIGVAEFVGKMKANSSGWIRKTLPNQRLFQWQVGYAAFSVSVSQKPKVVAYVANQEKHHRKISFQEEYIGFLKKHGIAYDERYVFD